MANFRESLNECQLRLRIILQNYNFIVNYLPRSQLYFADERSRASYDDNFQIKEGEINAQVRMIYDDNVIRSG